MNEEQQYTKEELEEMYPFFNVRRLIVAIVIIFAVGVSAWVT